MGFGVWGLGFGVRGSGFGVRIVPRFRLRFRRETWFRVGGVRFGFGVWGAGLGASGFGRMLGTSWVVGFGVSV